MQKHGPGWDEARERNDWQAMAYQWAYERGQSQPWWTQPEVVWQDVVGVVVILIGLIVGLWIALSLLG